MKDGFREVEVLRELRGSPNVVSLLGLFNGPPGKNPEDRHLNLVLEYMPDTLQRIIKHTRYLGSTLEMIYVRLYCYQLCRGAASLLRKQIIHRDLKPANLLVDPRTCILKVCDFGTAKMPSDDELTDQPYLCSRFYRAPELILSATPTTAAVDFWSIGCILVELLRGHVLFQGTDGVNQFMHIIEILGTPTPAELYAMNPMYDAAVGFGLKIEPVPWNVVVGSAPPDAVALIGRLLRYEPAKRALPMDAMASDFFNALRTDATQLGHFLFNFSSEELENLSPSVRERLLNVRR
jgi:serine/threonine protein kinase